MDVALPVGEAQYLVDLPLMAALERHGNGLKDTCPAVITLGGNTDADTF